MVLRDELLRQGEWCHRQRGKLTLLFLALFLLVLRDSNWIEDRFGDALDDAYDLACIAISALGLAIRVAVAGTAPASAWRRGEVDVPRLSALDRSGIHSLVRHPICLGNFLLLLGPCLAPGSLLYALAVSAVFWLIHERLMLAEEAALRGRFRGSFDRWANRTPALLPRRGTYRPPQMPFSFRTAARREYPTLLAISVLFAVLDYAEDLLAAAPHLEWEGETTLPALAIAVGCLALHLLRTRTRLLDLPGR